MKFYLFDSTEDDEHSDIAIVEIYDIFSTQDGFFFGMMPSSTWQIKNPRHSNYVCDTVLERASLLYSVYRVPSYPASYELHFNCSTKLAY